MKIIQDFFLPALMINITIRTIIAITIKIPKLIPALKIPSTTPHEAKDNRVNAMANNLR